MSTLATFPVQPSALRVGDTLMLQGEDIAHLDVGGPPDRVEVFTADPER